MNSFRLLKLVLYLLLSVVLFTDCSKDNDAILKVSSTVCAFNADGGEKTITVGTDTPPWSAAITDDFKGHFSLNIKDNLFIIKATENTDEFLTTLVNVTAGNVTIPIKVTQQVMPKNEYISVIPDIENYTFYYEGGVFEASVSGTDEWTASCEAEWCTVYTDTAAGTLTVSAAQNIADEVRTTTLYISGNSEVSEAGKTISLVQTGQKDDPYYSVIGEWNLHCSKWKKSNGEEYPAGSYASCRIDYDSYNESYVIRDLFKEGSTIIAPYNKFEDSLNIPLGWLILNDGTFKYFYVITQISPEGNSFNLGEGGIYGILSADRKTITFKGIEAGWGFGVVAYSTQLQDYITLNYLYYAADNDIVLQKADS